MREFRRNLLGLLARSAAYDQTTLTLTFDDISGNYTLHGGDDYIKINSDDPTQYIYNGGNYKPAISKSVSTQHYKLNNYKYPIGSVAGIDYPTETTTISPETENDYQATALNYYTIEPKTYTLSPKVTISDTSYSDYTISGGPGATVEIGRYVYSSISKDVSVSITSSNGVITGNTAWLTSDSKTIGTGITYDTSYLVDSSQTISYSSSCPGVNTSAYPNSKSVDSGLEGITLTYYSYDIVGTSTGYNWAHIYIDDNSTNTVTGSTSYFDNYDPIGYSVSSGYSYWDGSAYTFSVSLDPRTGDVSGDTEFFSCPSTSGGTHNQYSLSIYTTGNTTYKISGLSSQYFDYTVGHTDGSYYFSSISLKSTYSPGTYDYTGMTLYGNDGTTAYNVRSYTCYNWNSFYWSSKPTQISPVDSGSYRYTTTAPSSNSQFLA